MESTFKVSRWTSSFFMNVEWIIAPPAPPDFIAALSDLHPLTAQTLYARGHTDPAEARAFLTGEYPKPDPMLMADMPKAVERILSAIAQGEQLAVYGDYDCDGVTSCALMKRTLDALNAKACVYIPDRFEEGYGVNSAALDKLKGQGVSLVITVDCGARAFKEATHAQAIDLDLVVTDHHDLEDERIPDALAVIDPKRADCAYGYKHLAGVGVALRLAQALLNEAGKRGMPRNGLNVSALLDYVAIGTVADVVRLTGENRKLVGAGLQKINFAPRAGVAALLQTAGLRKGAITAGQIGFALAPRLNAAGRLENAKAAYELLITDDKDVADALAVQLNQQNSKRQSITATMAHEAEKIALSGAEAGKVPALLFAASPLFNAGVIGLAAARLMDKYYRPAVVVSIDHETGEARGSCRSVNGFNITRALDECDAMLLKHGGHAAAAGFTTTQDKLAELLRCLIAIAERNQPADGWQRAIRADAEFDLAQTNTDVLGQLKQFEPHGLGNPKPTFVARRALVKEVMRMGRSEAGPPPHLRMIVKSGLATWEVVGWRMGERITELADDVYIDLAFQFDENEWNGQRRIQLNALDFRCVV
jgi:single-stranded-DNA-specific exonuclease